MFYCVAASLLEQWIPELLGAEAGAQLPGGGAHPGPRPHHLIQLHVVRQQQHSSLPHVDSVGEPN